MDDGIDKVTPINVILLVLADMLSFTATKCDTADKAATEVLIQSSNDKPGLPIEAGRLEIGSIFMSNTFSRSCHDRISRRV